MKNFKLILFLLTIPLFMTAQEKEEKAWYEVGRVYGKIFSNVHTGIGDNKDKGFEVKRAYFGYQADLNEHFAGNIKLDIGNQNDIQDYAAKKRFAYFKNAYVQYKFKGLKIQFGIADCFQFKLQEKFWGYRYIQQSFQDKNKFGPSADLGIFANYKLGKKVSFDISLSNGEGYSAIQQDDYFKASFGISYKPLKALVIRGYIDAYDSDEATQYSANGFIGITTKYFTLGNEFNYQANSKHLENQDLYGWSFYSTVKLMDQVKVFGRYDYLSSNKLNGDDIPWNLAKDGSSIIAGLEYQPMKYVKMALNYQDFIAYASNGNDSHYVYFNVELNF
jgi:hypothetical protein